jgi:uncharacterized protein (TIGR02246 family)
VEQDVGWLLDRAKIRELTAHYNRCFDDGDPEGFAQAFTEDGIMEVAGGPTTKGREALAAMCKSVPWGILHVTVDPIITVDGDTATQFVTLVVVGRPRKPGHQPKLVSSGRYEDTLVRTAKGWRFSRRLCTLDGGLG